MSGRGLAAFFVALALVAASAPRAVAQDPCVSGWSDGLFPVPGVGGGDVRALAEFDDGAGRALYAGGSFTTAGAIRAARLARWNGVDFSDVAGGFDAPVSALAVFDDGRGPALFAAGDFSRAGDVPAARIARFDGARWEPLGSGLDGPATIMAVYDAGSGPALFVSGSFASAGGIAVRSIARWDGASWSALGAGLSSPALALEVHDDGRGAALFAGGDFNYAGGRAALRVARWDGASWESLGAGLDGTVRDLASFDDGSGPALFAAGDFSRSGETLTLYVARWRGTSWEPAGAGRSFGGGSLHVHDDGTTRVLITAVHLGDAAVWSGSRWSPFAGEFSFGRANAFASLGDGSLLAGGAFDAVADGIARWDGTAWVALTPGIDDEVTVLTVFDDGSGPSLVLGGVFENAVGVPAARVAKWDGVSFSPLGSGFDERVDTLAVADDGTGPALYAGGYFVSSGGTPVSRIARWDGTSWIAIGAGFDARVRAIATFDDGGGPALYAGGTFRQSGGAFIGSIARWNGLAWTAVAGPAGPIIGDVYDLEAFDDGTGPALYAAGIFRGPIGLPLNGVARWDGVEWSPLGSGMNSRGLDFAAFDDGTGPALYLGGTFFEIGGVVSQGVARWSDGAWHGVGGVGCEPFCGVEVRALAVHDMGLGPELVAAGLFSRLAGVPASGVARWNGIEWAALGEGVAGEASALAVFDDGRSLEPALFVGGAFGAAGGLPSGNLARFMDECGRCRDGTVNAASGSVADVLFVNDSSGDRRRELRLTTYEPLTIFMAPSPASSGGSRFALYLWRAAPAPGSARRLPLGLGITCLPTPLTGGGAPFPREIWNNTGKARAGVPTRDSSPAPSTVFRAPAGLGRPASFFLQGIIADPASIGERAASVTNGIHVTVN